MIYAAFAIGAGLGLSLGLILGYARWMTDDANDTDDEEQRWTRRERT